MFSCYRKKHRINSLNTNENNENTLIQYNIGNMNIDNIRSENNNIISNSIDTINTITTQLNTINADNAYVGVNNNNSRFSRNHKVKLDTQNIESLIKNTNALINQNKFLLDELTALRIKNNYNAREKLKLSDNVVNLSSENKKLLQLNLNLNKSIKKYKKYTDDLIQEHESILLEVISENNRINNNLATISEAKSINNAFLCVVCIHNVRDIILLPCNHNILCNECLIQLKECPICRKNIDSYTKVYF